MKYRREIDGLRAVAVLSVILFHAGFAWFQGGFVGVDVFFVISGFLISSLLMTEIRAGEFSIVNFYERRARRIMPALFLVILATLPISFLLMLPFQLVNFAKSVAAVLGFASNILFWRESSYFDAATELKPLLHTWSLAIEEQFYVIYPLFILALWKLTPRNVGAILAIAAVSSLALCEWTVHRYLVANFYLLPTRAWELLIGCLAAFYVSGPRDRAQRFAGEVFSLLGIALIFFGVFFFSRATPFPSLYALAPTVGTALVLVFATPGTLAHRALGQKALVGIGLISYSAYLWHQPLFAFARLARHGDELSTAACAALIFLTGALAWASTRFLERPFRQKNLIPRKWIFSGTLGVSACLLLLAVPTIRTGGFLARFPEKDRGLLAINPVEMGRYTEARFRKLEGTKFSGASGKLRVAVIGDSFAEDFVNAAFENGYLQSAEVVTFAVAARCPKYLGHDDLAALYKSSGEYFDELYCTKQSNIADSLALARSADVVVLAANWKVWEAARIRETISAFGLSPKQRLFVIGSKNFGSVSPISYLSLPGQERIALRNPMPASQIEANAYLRRFVPESQFIDFQKVLCGSYDSCILFTPAEDLLAFDNGHFTPMGAKFAGKLLFELPALKELKK